MINAESLSRVRNDIQSYIGHKVRFKANKGRKRIYAREGIIEETYPCVFVIKIDTNSQTVQRVSYSYCDVLTQTVELVVCSNNYRI
ncbi:MAG TPA: Veg protein [Clostridiales bacterium]|nr:Veg protein [Clostridiales bacterium]